MTAIYAARWIVPIVSPPIENGAVAIAESEILAVGQKTDICRRFPDANLSEFGEAAILPGFVNAHSHLELTVMRGFLENETRDFSAWLKKLTLARMAMTETDLRVSAALGAVEAARAGITSLGDSSSLASETIRALREVGLRGTVYQESFGPDPRSAAENCNKLRDQLRIAHESENAFVRAGVSPHAPYTVSAPQLELISEMAIGEGLPLMMHAAESRAEKLFMQSGTGPFADGLRKRGIEWRAPGMTSIEYLERHGVLRTRPLLAHCINVSDTDLELLKTNGARIAHCPKSNAKLGHGKAPFAKFVANGIECGLGSDSVASNNTCDLLEEARFATLLAQLDSPADEGSAISNSDKERAIAHNPGLRIAARDALFAATRGGAHVLGLSDRVGALNAGMQADITVVRLNGPHQKPASDPIASLVFSSSGRDVLLTVVAGKVIYRHSVVETVDENEVQRKVQEIRRKLDALPQS